MSVYFTLLLSFASLLLASGGKGSNSRESTSGTEEDEKYRKVKSKEKKTGQQHKFWIPTYQGSNPLNRRKISITTSEIDKYDTSIDESLSGINKNGKRSSKDVGTDNLRMPFVWDGDDIAHNRSVSDLISLASDDLTQESLSNKQSTDATSSDSSSEEFVTKKIQVKGKQQTTFVTAKPLVDTTERRKKQIKPGLQQKNPSAKEKYVEKELTSKFFDELNKAATNETTLTAEYYKRLVKAATDNTKHKLGYNKMAKSQTNNVFSQHEVIAVNIDSKSLEKTQKKDEIHFVTRHEPLQEKPDFKEQKHKETVQSMKEIKVKSLKKELSEKQLKSKLRFPKDRRSSRVEGKEKFDSNETTENSFTEFCDYSAWSDVLTRNRTQQKSKKQKTKSHYSFEKLTDIRKWPGHKIKKKANEIRRNEGKVFRKNKVSKAYKKKNEEERSGKEGNYDYENDYDKSEKKVRMKTTGEKRHAIKEVKNYLKEMDEIHGGRPGGEYKKKEMTSDKRGGRSKGRRDYERRGKGIGEGDQRKGRDYGYKRRAPKEEYWDGRDSERGNRRWQERASPRRGDEKEKRWGGRTSRRGDGERRDRMGDRRWEDRVDQRRRNDRWDREKDHRGGGRRGVDWRGGRRDGRGSSKMGRGYGRGRADRSRRGSDKRKEGGGRRRYR